VSRLVHIVDERVHQGDQVGRVEFQPVKVAAEPAVAIDYMRHHAMRVFAVFGLGEFVAELLGELPGCRRRADPGASSGMSNSRRLARERVRKL